jgi:hypothetical protein
MATGTHAKTVPAVSSGTAGPLGVVHLPRLWLKLTLAAAGELPDGYDECGTGFDAMTLDALGLDRQKTIDFVRQNKPRYMEFEAWAFLHGKTDKEAIEKHNAAVRGYHHSDEHGREMRRASGVKSEAVKDAVTLNMIEDLDEIYDQVVKP